jgi:acetyl-CoA carboxylase carboxyl transferase subunit alpha
MLEHSIYSVISPEGCAAILWKKNNAEVGQQEYEKASEALKLTAQDLYDLDIIEEIIPEPIGGAHRNPKEAAAIITKVLKKHLEELMKQSLDTLLNGRYKKFRLIGAIQEEG